MLQLLLQSPDFDPYSSEQKLIPPQNTERPSNSAQMTATAAPRVAPQPTLLLPRSGEVPSKGPDHSVFWDLTGCETHRRASEFLN